jgi:hypothetical protein
MASYDDRERIYHTGYRAGFKDGMDHAEKRFMDIESKIHQAEEYALRSLEGGGQKYKKKSRSAKPNSWTRFLKANSSKPWARYKSGPKKGLIKMKEMSRRYRKKKR